MNIISKVLLVLITILLLSCNKLEYSNLKTVDIGDYQLEVPSQFQVIVKQGIDSYVGVLAGERIEINYDFGVYTSPFKDLSSSKFDIFQESFGFVERQIVVAKNPAEDITGMHIRDLENFSDLGNYVSLKMYTDNISRKQQKLVVKILESTHLK